MKPKFFWITIALIGWAAQASGLTLEQAYQLALAQDKKLAIAQAQLEADSEQPEQAMAQFRPQLSTSISQKQESYRLPTDSQLRNETTQNQGLQLTQALYNRKGLYQLDQADLKVDYAKLRLANAQSELSVRLVQSYLNCLLSQQNHQLSIQQAQQIEARLNQVSAALLRGYATKVDMLGLKSELAIAKARSIQDWQQLAFHRKQLELLLGSSLPERLPWNGFNAQQLVANLFKAQDWLAVAKSTNLKVQLSAVNAQVARQQIEINRSEHYPVVNLGANYSDAEGSTYFAQKRENKLIYVELRMPLYQGGQADSKVREAIALSKVAAQQAALDQDEATQLTQEQLSSINAALERIDALDEALSAAAVYVQSAEEGFRLGVRDVVEVSRAQEKQLSLQRESLQVRLELVGSIAQLHALTGRLNDQTLQALSHHLMVKTR